VERILAAGGATIAKRCAGSPETQKPGFYQSFCILTQIELETRFLISNPSLSMVRDSQPRDAGFYHY
jgi:hypothetical protein